MALLGRLLVGLPAYIPVAYLITKEDDLITKCGIIKAK